MIDPTQLSEDEQFDLLRKKANWGLWLLAIVLLVVLLPYILMLPEVPVLKPYFDSFSKTVIQAWRQITN